MQLTKRLLVLLFLCLGVFFSNSVNAQIKAPTKKNTQKKTITPKNPEVLVKWLGNMVVVIQIGKEDYTFQEFSERRVRLPVGEAIGLTVSTPSESYKANEFLSIESSGGEVEVSLNAYGVSLTYTSGSDLAEQAENERLAEIKRKEDERLAEIERKEKEVKRQNTMKEALKHFAYKTCKSCKGSGKYEYSYKYVCTGYKNTGPFCTNGKVKEWYTNSYTYKREYYLVDCGNCNGTGEVTGYASKRCEECNGTKKSLQYVGEEYLSESDIEYLLKNSRQQIMENINESSGNGN